MKRFAPCVALLFFLVGVQAQSASDLSYPEIDSLLMLYQEPSAQQADAGLELALAASRLTGKMDSLSGHYWAWAAFFYETKADYPKAEAAYEKVLTIFAAACGKQSIRYAKALTSFGFFQRNRQKEPQALSLHTQAKDILEQAFGPDHPDVASALSNVATSHINMGNYEKAIPLLVQAKNIKEQVLGADDLSLAVPLSNLAALHHMLGQQEQALSLLIQAKDIQEKALGNMHPSFATSLNNLAVLYTQMGQYDQALPLYLQTKNIREKVLGKAHPQVALSLNNLAILYKRLGQYDQALPLYLEAKNNFEEALGPRHPSFALALANLAGLHRDMGNYEAAWQYALQSLEASTGQRNSAHITPSWADTLLKASAPSILHLEQAIHTLEIMHLLLQKDSTRPAPLPQQIIVSDLATALLTQYRNSVSNDKDKLRLLTQSHEWLQRSLTDLYQLNQAEKAFALVDQNKSVLLLQATQSEEAYRLGNLPDSMVEQDKKLQEQQLQLQANLLEDRPASEKDSLRRALNDLNEAMQALEAQIKTNHPKYHQFKYQQPTIDVAHVQALLDEETALLEYVISDSALHIFYIDLENVVWKKQLISKSALQQRIKDLHEALSNHQQLEFDPPKAYQAYIHPAHWFYTHLLAPVLEGRSGLKNLVIVTDGALGHLPFEAFLVEPAPQDETAYHKLHYLVADYNISYNYSAALWSENKQAVAPTNNGQIFGVAGNYDLELAPDLLDLRLPIDLESRASLNALPGARDEVQMLQDRYQGFFAFDSLASEKTVKQNASDFAILHFATHGLLDEQRPILSSLALSEDNDSTESNFWQAHEISKMTLHANLVVLSACQTGYGQFEQGNGIASLARAFMYAGAPSMVVSLWQVNDHATAQIMGYFYQHLADGLPIDQALRQAKLQYLKTAVGPTAHPVFWSPFIHIGQTEPIQLQTQGPGAFAWALLGGLGLLLLGGGWLLLRKRRTEVLA